MNILVACEFSGIVRDAFKAKGHYAVSCDLQPTEKPGLHFQNDVRILLNEGWDMMIAHPDCQYMSLNGARWDKIRPERELERLKALRFFEQLLNANVPKICIENPAGNYLVSRFNYPYTQRIHPYQFGGNYTKATGLWLKGLPPLTPTSIHPNPFVNAMKHRVYLRTDKDRKRTFPGIAAAMADQWG